MSTQDQKNAQAKFQAEFAAKLDSLDKQQQLEFVHRATLELLFTNKRPRLPEGQFNDIYNTVQEAYRTAIVAEFLSNIIPYIRQALKVDKNSCEHVLVYDTCICEAQEQTVEIGRKAAKRLEVLIDLLRPTEEPST